MVLSWGETIYQDWGFRILHKTSNILSFCLNESSSPLTLLSTGAKIITILCEVYALNQSWCHTFNKSFLRHFRVHSTVQSTRQHEKVWDIPWLPMSLEFSWADCAYTSRFFITSATWEAPKKHIWEFNFHLLGLQACAETVLLTPLFKMETF